MYAQPSRILATANRVDGDTSPPFYIEIEIIGFLKKVSLGCFMEHYLAVQL